MENEYAQEEEGLPLLARVGDGHGYPLLSHYPTFPSRVLGILLKESISSHWPVTLVIACSNTQNQCTTVVLQASTQTQRAVVVLQASTQKQCATDVLQASTQSKPASCVQDHPPHHQKQNSSHTVN